MNIPDDLRPLLKRWWGFYVISPWLVLALFILGPRTVELFQEENVVGGLVGSGVCFMVICIQLVLYAPESFSLCASVLGLLVFVAHTMYFVTEMASSKPSFGDGRKSSSSTFNALLGLGIFGLPGLCVFLGGFRRRSYNDTQTTDGPDAEHGDDDL